MANLKLRLNRWLCYGMVTVGLLMTSVPLADVSAHRTRPSNHYIIRSYSRHTRQNDSSIRQITSLPNQGYTNYVTGSHGLYTQPATTKGARRLLTRYRVRRLASWRVPFMAYQRAITNHNLVYYKIVSLHHSVRGWIYETDLRSTLNQKQQAAVVSLNPQIINAEMLADKSKHQSLINNSRVDLRQARKALYNAKASVRILNGTPDHSEVEQAIRKANHYLYQVQIAKPNYQTLKGLIAIRTKYQQADQSVNSAKVANMNHQNARAKRDIKHANRDLRAVHKILNQIRNYHDRRDAMNLFDQALGYINSSDAINSTVNMNGNSISLNRLSNQQVISLIDNDVKTAQNSIINLYPQLGNFDTTLTEAYQAQSDLNQAQNLVTELKSSHVQKTELNRIKAIQHNINALWNI